MVTQSTDELIIQLHRLGINLWVEQGQLRSRAPKGVLTPDLRTAIGLHKDALVALLTQSHDVALPPLRPYPRTAEIPLSPVQQGLWLLMQIETDKCIYNEVSALQLTGALVPALIERAFCEMIRRHEALRTAFRLTTDGRPLQVIQPPMFQLPLVDVSGLAEVDQEAALQRLIQEEARIVFDLEQGPLLRVKLVRRQSSANVYHVLLFTIHHLIGDGWSRAIILEELAVLYAAFLRGEPSPLPALTIQYADYAIWQRQRWESGAMQQQLDYWRIQLSQAPTLLALPTDRPRAPQRTFGGQQMSFALDATLLHPLRLLAQANGATLFMLLLSAFQILLARYSQQDDIVIGTPMANRQRQEIASLVGYFVNTVALRTSLAGNPTWRELLARVKKITLDAQAHQEVSFDQLIAISQPTRSNSYAPLFQVMFAFQNDSMVRQLRMADIAVQPLAVDTGVSKYDLTLTLVEFDERLEGSFEYNTALFDSATIARMVGHLQTLLQAIVTTPDQPIATLPLLTAAERRQLLVEWNQTTAAIDTGIISPYIHVSPCIHHLFEAQVTRTPTARAVVFAHSPRSPLLAQSPCHPVTLSYAELNRQANQVAHYLQTLGVGPETLVGLCLDRSPTLIVGLLGILKAGGAYVPLDPAYPQARLDAMIEDAKLAVLVTQTKYVERFTGYHGQTVDLDAAWSNITQHRGENPPQQATPTNLAYVIYTSGSTGQPKGVMIEQQALSTHIRNVSTLYGITPQDRVLQFAAFSFDAAQEQLFTALCNGATLVLRGDELWTTATFAQQVAVQGVSVADLPPVYFQQLLTAWHQERPAFLEKQLRLILLGGEKIQPETVRLWRQLACPATRLLNVYGPTEATITATLFDLTEYQPAATAVDLPIGKPLPGRQAYLLDPQRQPVPIGIFGELYLGGAGLARGYLRRPALTAEHFVPSPFAAEEPEMLYKTGDMARWLPDGTLEFQNRRDQQVKIRGFRIELGEIEAALLQQPSVQAALVRTWPEAEGETRLVAYLVLAETNSPLTEPIEYTVHLRNDLRKQLPDYMMPTDFVRIDAIPLLPNGKIDRNALPSPPPRTERQSHCLPQTPVEQQLARLWSVVLKQPISNVQTNFFEAGGHSILAVQLMQQVQQHFAIPLPLVTLFQYPTIEQLAAVLTEQNAPAHHSPLVPIRASGDRPPFFCVHGADGNVLQFYALAQRLPEEQPFYGLQAVGFDGKISPHTAVEAMATAYLAALRTIQPHGPYWLGGYSLGGEVAFAMAHQLEQAGEAIGLLVLLDSYAPGTVPFIESTDLLLDAAQLIGMAMGVTVTVTATTAATLPAAERIDSLAQQLQRDGLLSVNGDNGSIRNWLQVCLANLQMRYLPSGAINAPTLLLRAEERPASWQRQDETLGWRKFLMQPITIETVPGDHFSMWHAPHVQTLATRLHRHLTQTQHKSLF